MVFIDQQRIDDIQAQIDLLQAQTDLKQGEITLNGGDPVLWTESERGDVMKIATLIAYLSENNLACYPLSVSSVVFFGPTPP